MTGDEEQKNWIKLLDKCVGRNDDTPLIFSVQRFQIFSMHIIYLWPDTWALVSERKQPRNRIHARKYTMHSQIV